MANVGDQAERNHWVGLVLAEEHWIGEAFATVLLPRLPDGLAAFEGLPPVPDDERDYHVADRSVSAAGNAGWTLLASA